MDQFSSKAHALLSKAEPDTFYELYRPLADGLLCTVPEISLHVMGSNDPASVRATYSILETGLSLPAFKRGGIWCLRLDELAAKLWTQSRRCWSTEEQEKLARLHIVLSMLLPTLMTKAPDVSMLTRQVLLVEEAIKTIDRLLHDKSQS